MNTIIDEGLSQYQLFLGLTTYACIFGTYCGSIVTIYLGEKWFKPHHIQRESNETERWLCFRMVTFNLTWLFVATFFSGPFLEETLLDYDSQLPGVSEFIARFLLFFVIDDTWFYCYHRLVHSVPTLYIAVHKQHHVFTAPFAAVAFAVHPAEMMLQAFGSTLGPLLIFHGQTHPVLFWTFLVIRQLQGIEDHLGFELAYSPTHLFPSIFGGTSFHDVHHQKFKCNYASTFSFIDKAFGTIQQHKVACS
jgi:sterol desaturase/sphingolipid hydroxylase (fatty acid hydroxylase superfamily)